MKKALPSLDGIIDQRRRRVARSLERLEEAHAVQAECDGAPLAFAILDTMKDVLSFFATNITSPDISFTEMVSKFAAEVEADLKDSREAK